MPDLERSALSVHGETTVTLDIWESGEVTLLIENHVATVQMELISIMAFSELEVFMRTATSAEPREYEIADSTGVIAVCSREDSQVVFSLLGDAEAGPRRHLISIHLYGPSLIEFLDCLSDLREELAANA